MGCHSGLSEVYEFDEEQPLTDILLAAAIFILIVALRRTRQRKRPYRGLFTSVDTAIRRETDKVFSALHASVPDGRAPGHCRNNFLSGLKVRDEGAGTC